MIENNSGIRSGEGETSLVELMIGADTIKLREPITNDLLSDAGKTIAFTQHQRYVG